MHHLLLIPASHHWWCWVPVSANLGCILNVRVTEGGCTESHSELRSALQNTGQNSYADVPWSRSWLEEVEGWIPVMRKALKGQDAMTSRGPNRIVFPRAETLVFPPAPFSSSLKRTNLKRPCSKCDWVGS